jgi:hypothetical protein
MAQRPPCTICAQRTGGSGPGMPGVRLGRTGDCPVRGATGCAATTRTTPPEERRNSQAGAVSRSHAGLRARGALRTHRSNYGRRKHSTGRERKFFFRGSLRAACRQFTLQKTGELPDTIACTDKLTQTALLAVRHSGLRLPKSVQGDLPGVGARELDGRSSGLLEVIRPVEHPQVVTQEVSLGE